MLPFPVFNCRMLTNFASSNKLVFYTPSNSLINLIDFEPLEPVSHKLEVPFLIKSVHPLSEDKYLVVSMPEVEAEGKDVISGPVIPRGERKTFWKIFSCSWTVMDY